mgnify:CR=1 FL=1
MSVFGDKSPAGSPYKRICSRLCDAAVNSSGLAFVATAFIYTSGASKDEIFAFYITNMSVLFIVLISHFIYLILDPTEVRAHAWSTLWIIWLVGILFAFNIAFTIGLFSTDQLTFQTNLTL